MDHATEDVPTEREPFVSIVVPTSNRAGVLADCLESLTRQDYPKDRYEVLVVENGRPDGTAELTRSLAAGAPQPRIHHLSRSRSDANAARNAGLAAARGDPVCFVDDDVIVPDGWLSALVAGTMRNTFAGCLGGPIRPLLDGSPPRTCDDHELAGIAFEDEGPEAEVGEVWGGNLAIRRDAVEAVGPFREGLHRHQEWEWEQRLLRGGGRIVYVPDAWLWHRRATTDLRVHRLVREFFLRGYTKASLGFPVEARWTARRARRNLAHGVRRRCTRGLTEAARDAGLLWATLLRRGNGGPP
jgi:glycosyltransferase involved in cell wall biosynthesis